MFLFKARLAAQREYADALARIGKSAEDVRAFFEANPRFASGLHRAPHAAAGTAADRLAEIAPLMGKSNVEIRLRELERGAKRTWTKLRAAPEKLRGLRARWVEKSPAFLAQVREEWTEARPAIAQKVRDTARARAELMWAAVRGPSAPAAPAREARP